MVLEASQWRIVAVRWFINWPFAKKSVAVRRFMMWPFANLWCGRSPKKWLAVRGLIEWPFAGWLSGRSSGRSRQIFSPHGRTATQWPFIRSGPLMWHKLNPVIFNPMKERNCIGKCFGNSRERSWYGSWICHSFSHRYWFSCECDSLRQLPQWCVDPVLRRFQFAQTSTFDPGLHFNWNIYFESRWNDCCLWSWPWTSP